jgi:hypothetical protein
MNDIIKNEIKQIAEIVLEQTNKLLNYEAGAPQIEVDITKDNIRKLYDKIDILVDKNWKSISSPENNIDKQLDEQVDELLNIAEAEFNNSIEEITKQMVDLTDEQYETQEEEIELDTANIEKEIAEVTNATVKEELIEEKPAPNNIEADINTQVETHSIGDQLQRKPLKSLKTSIGINDKFQFINELFDGSMKIYNQAMDQLEQSENQAKAVETFHSIAKTGNWDEENPAYSQLLDYVERRFL